MYSLGNLDTEVTRADNVDKSSFINAL